MPLTHLLRPICGLAYVPELFLLQQDPWLQSLVAAFYKLYGELTDSRHKSKNLPDS